ncbi:MAG: hypothetical protein DI528_08175 [Shinella sp.]|nr:MAG: hypothetical protein DI528_08175 [Shinella sp.]
MKQQITTIQSPTATLTEKELFGQFLKMHVQHWTNFGTLGREYRPEDILRAGGEWWGVMEILSETFADSLEDESDPTGGLNEMISDLETYLESLRLILSDFDSLKAVKLIMPEEPDEDDEEAYEAWELAANAAEDNPRYRPVMDASEAQEAA